MTAAASFTGLIGAVAPANAAPDAYVAVAVGLVNDAPPVTTVGGISIGSDQNQVYQAALSDCVGKGGHQCVVEAVKQNGCAAAASNDFGEMVGGTDVTLRKAQENARAKLQNQQGMRVVASGCSNGDVPPPPPPSAPPAPELGPTASFNPTLGGLEAHITDRSGVASQCTYAMENVNRSFGLAANADVRPADRSAPAEVPGPERDDHLRQRHQDSDVDALLSGATVRLHTRQHGGGPTAAPYAASLHISCAPMNQLPVRTVVPAKPHAPAAATGRVWHPAGP